MLATFSALALIPWEALAGGSQQEALRAKIEQVGLGYLLGLVPWDMSATGLSGAGTPAPQLTLSWNQSLAKAGCFFFKCCHLACTTAGALELMTFRNKFLGFNGRESSQLSFVDLVRFCLAYFCGLSTYDSHLKNIKMFLMVILGGIFQPFF